MFHKLVSHNDDIRRLVEKGYAVAFDGNNYLVVRDIPYLDAGGALCIGAIISKFVDRGDDRIAQEDHQVFFAGSAPHGLDGKPIPNLGGGPTSLALSDDSRDVVVQRSFSNKPKAAGAFADFYEKIESYVSIISGPAIERHDATPLTFRTVEVSESTSPFKFRDTLTSRAEICDLAGRFKDDVIAIIGLGGTGAYVLEFLIKTPVKEIRGFDLDVFHVHTAFRSPGRLDEAELGKPKADVYQGRYENFRTGLSLEAKYIDASCADELKGVTFAFVCVDSGPSRAGIFDLLIKLEIPYIDVGMGLDRNHGTLNGMVRTTYYSSAEASKTRDKGLAELVETPDDMYRRNIQIGELNALNACLAVIRFKQIRGFYRQEMPYYHLLYSIGDMKILGHAEGDDD
jgi:hypothetical protein